MNDEVIKIMSDYGCFPLWRIGNGSVENLSPDELSIPESLKKQLVAWQKKYDEALNQIDPRESGFKNQDEEEQFEREGYRIWQQLTNELKESYKVTYFSRKEGKLYA